ncbi:hypothetical protein [Evansella cellulosilytica]|uniref:Uncharacterized protein n=1 Tax=Evansella cellulosilytica (strain ATCC 21833 / DSM 2522 / FERM P-1141 / JCM 9156 / N-4) TaxID=649639 RepID=E6TVM8_EVAC2|nr:hypothetical protein [Evansella cellulosilytica]ADU32156.1 hypothetical protein Bcell_3921 [Evansella cellulosilytica DSM 2522]
MNKSDFRVQFPLWNIALWSILIVWSYGVVYAFDRMHGGFDDLFYFSNGELIVNWNVPAVLSFSIGMILLIGFFIAYSIRLRRHNKEHPHHKMAAFTLLKPSEFIEDDEMLRQVTESATKKVYVLYSQALPLFIFFVLIFPFNRYVYVVLLLLLLVAHNAVYYREIRKFVNGEFTVKTVSRTKTSKLPNLFIGVLVLMIVIAVAVPAVRIVQLELNQRNTMAQFEDCLNDGKSAIVEFDENGFSSVRCE